MNLIFSFSHFIDSYIKMRIIKILVKWYKAIKAALGMQN